MQAVSAFFGRISLARVIEGKVVQTENSRSTAPSVLETSTSNKRDRNSKPMLTIVAAIHAPDSITKILDSLALPSRAPPVAPPYRHSQPGFDTSQMCPAQQTVGSRQIPCEST